MSLIGKIHEIALYGLISAVISLANGKVSFLELLNAAFHVSGFRTLFLAFLFWSSVAFLPIAVIASFATKYSEDGVGLSFTSDNLFVIFFAHIAEDLLGLVCTPFWFLKDVFTRNLDDGWRCFDYFTYVLELTFIAIGLLTIW